jgi:hypothetical protein
VKHAPAKEQFSMIDASKKKGRALNLLMVAAATIETKEHVLPRMVYLQMDMLNNAQR